MKVINHGINKLKTISESGAGFVPKKGGNRRRKIGKETEAKMEAKETYPVNIIVITATAKQNGKAVGNKAMSTPPRVPTPLPPLNPANIV